MPGPSLTNAQHLRAFHRALGLTPPARPTVPDAALLELRRTLIREEWEEVQSEFGALAPRLDTATPADLAPLVHELVDLLYVTYGALDMLGVNADAAFAEVQRANLSKAGGPKRADGKQLKPEGWQPANIPAVLHRLAGEVLE